jgi:beta-lactamase class A
MLDILLAQQFNEKIPAGLPPGVRVAHKTGEITAVSHDAAIVYPPGRSPYVLVVLTRGIADGAQSARLIADISRLVFAYNAARNTSTHSGN